MQIFLQLPRKTCKKKNIWAFVGLILIGALITSIVVRLSSERQPAPIPEQNSLPVNAVIEGRNIEFSVNAVQEDLKGEDYFVNFRLKREQTRQEEKSMLAAILNSNGTKTKEEAEKKWLELTTKIKQEDEIENLLKIQGFQDAVIDVSRDSANVMIYAPTLSPNEVSRIQDIVTRVTAIRLDHIHIATRN